MNAAPERLRTAQKFGWGVGSLGSVTVINVQSLLLLFYLTSILGVSPVLAGTLLFATKIVDAVFAPIVGARSDRTTSAMGRRRPYLLAGAFISAISVAAIFNPPIGGDATVVWITIALVGLALGYSLFNVPYLAMPAEMTSSPAERTSIMSWRIGFVSFGGLVAAFAPALAKAAGGGPRGYGVMGLAVAAIVLVAMLVAFRASRTLYGGPASTGGGGTYARFGVVFGNRPFMLIIAAKVLQLIGLASISASLLFMVKYVIEGNEVLIAAYGGSAGLTAMAAMPLWVWLGKRWSKKTLYILSCLCFAAVTLSWLLASPAETALTLAIRGVAAGLFSGGLLLMGQSMLPDAIDWDCKRSGERREGVYAGAYSFVEKASMALGPLLVGFILQAFHFAPRQAVQSPEALTGIIIGAAVLPAACYALSVIPLLGYQLDSRPTPRPVPAA